MTATATEINAVESYVVYAADVDGASVRVGRNATRISWQDLRNAGAAPMYGLLGIHGGQPDDDLRDAYRSILAQAAGQLRRHPRNRQGIRVVVHDGGTGGAAWSVDVRDASGEYRRDLMLADEGMQYPHRRLARREAEEIFERLGCGRLDDLH